jgi:hypothetical protein
VQGEAMHLKWLRESDRAIGQLVEEGFFGSEKKEVSIGECMLQVPSQAAAKNNQLIPYKKLVLKKKFFKF